MSEEEYKLFQLIKQKPVNNCRDLTEYMRGKRYGIFYFTEMFRVDFENKMYSIAKLKEKIENQQEEIEELKK